MDWSDERYVRLYTRDTVTWKLIKWQGRHVLTELFRKVDRAGVLDFGDEGIEEAISALIDTPLEVVSIGLEKILERGVAVIQGSSLVLPNFLEAQEAAQSDKHRQRESRAKRRDLARHGVTKRDSPSNDFTDAGVTFCDSDEEGAEASSVTKPVPGVTKPVTGVTKPVETVTLSLAMPSRTVPSASQTKTQTRASARAGAGAEAIPDIERDGAGFPVQPRRKTSLLNAPVTADEYEPMPEHEGYALGLGLTRSEYQVALDELVEKTKRRGGRAVPLSRMDSWLCGFIEAAAQSKTRVRPSSKLSVVAPVVPWVQPTTNTFDRTGPVYRALFLDDDDDEGKEA